MYVNFYGPHGNVSCGPYEHIACQDGEIAVLRNGLEYIAAHDGKNWWVSALELDVPDEESIPFERAELSPMEIP